MALGSTDQMTTAAPTRVAAKASNLPDSVRRVLAKGHLDLDRPDIRELIGPSMMNGLGIAAAAVWSVMATSPVSTAVLTDRPTFTWTEKSGATYRVTVTDLDGNTIDESPELTSPSWKADKPLPRGQVLRWQVKTTQNGMTLATSPESGARFRVLDTDRAAQIEDAQKTFADQPLALGILYAQAGMLDDAERAFDKAKREDPQNEIIGKLQADLKAVRNSGL